MKILFLNQFFWPDSSATSQMLTDLANGLGNLGHEVTVLCSEGGYAMAASSQAPDVKICRVTVLPFKRGKAGRILSYFSFYAAALARGLTLPRHDVVVSLTTPPLISLLGSAIKRLRGSAHYIWEQDLYPDVATDLKYFKRGGIADRMLGFFADRARHDADGIIALGECMKQRLLARGIPAERISIAENWADGTTIKPLPRPGDPNQLVLLYSGNFGLAHDLGTLTGALQLLGEDTCIRFLIVGSGSKRTALKSFCETNRIDFVEFRPYVSRDRLSEGLAAGDIGLVTQSDLCCGSVVPSKVYGILAAQRPFLFIGPLAATPARIIARYRCGWHIDCGDSSGLRSLLLYLAAHPHLIHEAGSRARKAFLDHHDLPQGVQRIADILDRSNPVQIAARQEHSSLNLQSMPREL